MYFVSLLWSACDAKVSAFQCGRHLWAQKYLNSSQTIRADTQILLEQEYVILV